MAVNIDAMLQPFKAVMPVKGVFTKWSIIDQEDGSHRISGTLMRDIPERGCNTSNILLLVPPQGKGQPGFVVTANSLYILKPQV